MQIAEKIFNERKRLGLSQEQLAEQMEVSRQAVSKWESGQSMPDLDKLVLMSQIFGVTTDYLLKEEENPFIQSPNSLTQSVSQNEESFSTNSDIPANNTSEQSEPVRILNTEEIQQYQNVCFKTAKNIALGVSLCVIGVILYLIMGVYISSSATNDGQATIALLLCVAPAVALFISSGMKMESYRSLKTDLFQLSDTNRNQLKKEYEKYSHTFTVRIVTGVTLCIVAVIAYLAVEAIEKSQPMLTHTGTIPTIVLLSFIAVAVYLFVSSGIRKDCYNVLLSQNGFTDIQKQTRQEENALIGVVAGTYWCIVTAGFLAYSFITNDWGRSWVVWPVAGCLFGAISTLLTFCTKNHK